MPFTSTICVISADDDCLQKYQQKYGVDACLHYLQKPFLLDELYGIASIAQERLQASLPGRRFVRTGSIDLKPDQMVDQASYCNVC